MTVAQSAPVAPTAPVCHECISIRVGIPHVGRGPAADIADNHFTEIPLPGGRFRGFDAHAETRAIDGMHPWDMSGPARIVLTPGKPGTYDSCGQWLNHAEIVGGKTLGFIHDETACHYANNFQTHMSFSLAVSNDYGLTWNNYGQILTGTDTPTTGKQTGEGSCTFVNGQDSYYYGYCFRNKDRALIVARAPVSNPAPGSWKKFFKGNWDEPGLGGDATGLGNGSGISVARWTATGEFAFTGWVRGGLGIFFSADHTTLTPLSEPILPFDTVPSKSSTPTERIMYMTFLDAKTGDNQLSNFWMLVYADWPPDASGKKYLLFRDVTVSVSSKPVIPQVGVLLARWYNPALHDRWSTTAAVPPVNGNGYKLETTSGYLMTVANAGGKPSVELEDCVSQRSGHSDHLLAEKGFCAAHDYQKLRTAGWVYSSPQENSIPLYRCYNDQEHLHFASNQPDCEKLGEMERLLGYALSK
jgi:hypothetical protein